MEEFKFFKNLLHLFCINMWANLEFFSVELENALTHHRGDVWVSNFCV